MSAHRFPCPTKCGRLTRRGPGRMCAKCRAELRRLAALRRLHYADQSEADAEAKGLRVELYRAVVERGGRLFPDQAKGGVR